MPKTQSLHRNARSPNGPCLSLAFGWNGQIRKLAVGPWATSATLAFCAVALAWSLAAGFYLCFHDALLASLIARQADMQYAYEDQIATLRTDLDRADSRNLIDRRMIDTTLHDLGARSDLLETRAATVDKLLTDGTAAAAHLPASASAAAGSAPPTLSLERGEGVPSRLQLSPGALRLNGAPEGNHADLDTDAMATRLAAIERAQVGEVVRLRDPLIRETRRLAAALTESGLRRRVLGAAPRDVGGPFVPLSTRDADGAIFDMQVALVRDALDRRDHLAAVVDHVPLRLPLDGALEVSSPFGARLDPFFGRPALHTGIDLRETGSDRVRATGEGVVTVAGPSGGYGNMVEVDHGAGIVTRYAHLSAIDVAVHQHVTVGSLLGRVGSSGRATGPHLHYETRIDGEPVDPSTFLTAGTRLAGG